MQSPKIFGPHQRRLYVTLLALRLAFALQPSYLHPDEHYQSLAPFAARFFPNWNSAGQVTWEWDARKPIRSVVVLWPLLGGLMRGVGLAGRGPEVLFYATRVAWFVLSIVVDLTIARVSPNPALALLLYASSYTTLVYQTHTFTNGLETVLVVLAVWLSMRICRSRSSPTSASGIFLGATCMIGTFARITFPGWVFLPVLSVVPTLAMQPRSALLAVSGAVLAALVAVGADTVYFQGSFASPVLTPLHNLFYNSDAANLAKHGLHPRWTHLLVNLPLMLGPGLLLIPRYIARLPMWCAVTGLLALSVFPHQEARFVLPAVPLMLASVKTLPSGRRSRRVWLTSWIAFNAALAVVFGVVHQGGVVPALLHAGKELERCTALPLGGVKRKHVWWKTYSPPTWLMGEPGATVDVSNLRGGPWSAVVDELIRNTGVTDIWDGWCSRTLLFAPLSARPFAENSSQVLLPSGRCLQLIETERWHLGFDDLDVESEGLVGTLRRNIGGAGLGIWAVS